MAGFDQWSKTIKKVGSELQTAELGSLEVQGMTRRAKRHVRSLWRWMKVGALMLACAFVIPVAMISLGLLFGPKGYEGLIAAPLAVLTSWALILFFALRRRVTPRRIEKARIDQLPEKAVHLLEQYRHLYPHEALLYADQLVARFESLSGMLESVDPHHPDALRLRRLVVDDLIPLLEHYRKLPQQLRDQSLHGGSAPKERFSAGMQTISRELERVQERLSAEHLHSFATQQRYVELKYDDKDKE